MRNVLMVTLMVVLATGFAFAGDSTKTETTPEPVEKAEAAPDSTKTEMVPAESAKTEATPDATKETKKLEFVTTESGLKYADLVVGEGKEAVNNMMVECHYTLWFANEKNEKGEKVQSSKDMGRTFEFEVGNPGLIKGWNEGMLGMKEGGTRMLIVPSELGYGSSPPPGIPKDQTLIFELEFIKAK